MSGASLKPWLYSSKSRSFGLLSTSLYPLPFSRKSGRKSEAFALFALLSTLLLIAISPKPSLYSRYSQASCLFEQVQTLCLIRATLKHFAYCRKFQAFALFVLVVGMNFKEMAAVNFNTDSLHKSCNLEHFSGRPRVPPMTGVSSEPFGLLQ